MSGAVPSASGYVPAGYSYVWGDEFDSPTVDFSKWAYQGWGQNAIAYEPRQMVDPTADARHIWQSGGILHLRSTREADGTITGPRALQTTAGRLALKYGYLELRANMTFRDNAWPAFWARSFAKTTDRRCMDYFSELDFIEAITWLGDRYLGTWHPNVQKWYEARNGNDQAAYTISADRYTTLGESRWSTYGILWTPERLLVTCDGTTVEDYDLTRDYDATGRSTTMLGNRDPHYLILNGYGTKYAGDMQVDYLRVYQPADMGAIYRLRYETHDPTATLNESPLEQDWLNYTHIMHATSPTRVLASWNTREDGTGATMRPDWRYNLPPGTTTLHAIWKRP